MIGGTDFLLVTGSTELALQNAMITASWQGYLPFSAMAVSASKYTVLMGRGVGSTVPQYTEITSSNMKTSDIAAGAKPLSSVVFPPMASVIVNIDPNNLTARTG